MSNEKTGIWITGASSGIGKAAVKEFASVGDVSNVYLAIKRKQVMFTQAKKIYILNKNHLIIFFIEDRFIHYLFYILMIAAS